MASFNIYISTYNCEKNRVDKSNFIDGITTRSVSLKEPLDVIHPTFILEDANINLFNTKNYVQVPTWSRYYFIENWSSLGFGTFEINCTIDILMSYKDEIKEQYAFVNRSASRYNPKLVDDKMVFETGFNEQIFHQDNSLFAENIADIQSLLGCSFVLTGMSLGVAHQ